MGVKAGPSADGEWPMPLGTAGLQVDTACMHTGDEPVSGGRRPHAPAQSTVCGVPLGKPPAGKTGAVNLDTSKYLGATAPSSSGGHPASSSASSRSAEKPLVFRHGECHSRGWHAYVGLP